MNFQMLKVQKIADIFPLFIIMVFIISYGEGSAIKTISTSCLCDISDSCDYECCCDSECPAEVTTILKKYNRCDDDNFGIPLCDRLNLTDVHYDDLYSGLKTIYTVIKRLFCVSRINIIDPTLYYTQNWVASDSVKTDAIARISSRIGVSTLQPANIASLNAIQINKIIFRSDVGLCSTIGSIPSGLGTNGIQECRAYLKEANQIQLNQYLSYEKLSQNFPNIRVYSMSNLTQAHLTTSTSSCTGTGTGTDSCQNVAKYIKLFINPSTNSVNMDISYIILGDLQNMSFPAYVMLKYDYEYLNADGTFANSSNIGYKIGSPLQLLKTTTDTSGNTYYNKVFNPINLAFRTSNGQCRTQDTEKVDESMVSLTLGRNQFHTCIEESSSQLLYQNLKNSFNMIGIMGSSNKVYGDYISVNWPSTITSNNNILVKIYYTKIGLAINPQYYILRVDVEPKSMQPKEKILFIQYQEVDNTPSMYIPAPPTIDAYLPNDFLYPFYVAA